MIAMCRLYKDTCLLLSEPGRTLTDTRWRGMRMVQDPLICRVPRMNLRDVPFGNTFNNRVGRFSCLGPGPKKTMRLVAQHATGWHVLFPNHPEDLVPAVSALEGWCHQFDRDPREIEWSLGLESDADGRVLAHHAERYFSMRFTQFTFGTSGPDYNLEGLQEWLA